MKTLNEYQMQKSGADSMVEAPPSFIDLFAGCGGLSLGLLESGWKGVFAVEKNKDAFQTLKHNLIDNTNHNIFEWPEWLPKKNITVSRIIKKYSDKLSGLKNKIDLVAGGPPCQGFSFLGGRKKCDNRNILYKDYIEFVKLVEPKFLLIENVNGINVQFGKKNGNGDNRLGRPAKSFSQRISEELRKINYVPAWQPIKAVDYGVPQFRPRYIMIGIKKDLLTDSKYNENQFMAFFKLLTDNRRCFLQQKGIWDSSKDYVSVLEAISDLETVGRELIPCPDSLGFKQINYEKPKTKYQELMHGNMNGDKPNSLRLANHREKTVEMFRSIKELCRPGVALNDEERLKVGMKKQCRVLLNSCKPSHTLSTLPDDLIHYSEPRILTVRECARLQSFPDWFAFKGKYTTGGNRRKKECPRYTQVGNAVPPLLAEALGRALIKLHFNIVITG